MSKGGSKFVRRAVAETRQQMEVKEFRVDSGLAMDLIIGACYKNSDVPSEHAAIIQRYWKVRKEYWEDGDEKKFKDQREIISTELARYEEDARLVAGIRIISSNFARHPGRS